ncbi:hypothetical protein CYLTODRAFT_102828 [Cylindrobasidium torrendii FP15055 ss-10]|uniref:Uncharacterized protein n=1 Tax=Cylindrobasidium torrendii FP15055 ss-10 TaxID=1314674 RepID=A0A0D7B2I2_9AGAR|nr:hypothetical protein CYLTODRAFT_102828 [Cylindrobasidium torrendii FP15055 ss-10]
MLAVHLRFICTGYVRALSCSESSTPPSRSLHYSTLYLMNSLDNTAPVTYARCLATMLDGFPFFEPRPQQLNKFKNFKVSGASYPYDLCFIGSRSRLSYIYSAGSHEAHPRNLDNNGNSLAPSWVEPYMDGEGSYLSLDKPDDEIVLSSGWNIRKIHATGGASVPYSLPETQFSVDAKFIIETHGITGALLSTPGTNNIEYDIEHLTALCNYVKANSVAWYRYSNALRMLDVSHGNLYLLTYVAKAQAFTSAVHVASEKSKSGDLSAGFSVFGFGALLGGGKTKAEGHEGRKFNTAETSKPRMGTATQGWMVRLVHWRLVLLEKGVNVEVEAANPEHSMAPSPRSETVRVPFRNLEAMAPKDLAPPSKPFPGFSSRNDGDRFCDGSDSEDEDNNGGGGHSGSPPPDGRQSSSGRSGISVFSLNARGFNAPTINAPTGGGSGDEGGSGSAAEAASARDQLSAYRSFHASRSARPAADRRQAAWDDLIAMESNLPRVIDPCALLGYEPTRSVHFVQDDRPYHPLYEIMDSMSESAPWARFTLAHDKDYLSVLKKGEVVPLGKELISRVAKKYVVEVDKDGFACLVDREERQLADDQLGFVLNLYRNATDVDNGFDVVRACKIPSEYVLFPPIHGGQLDLRWIQETPRMVNLHTAQHHNRTEFYEILHGFCIEYHYVDPSYGYCFVRPDPEDTNWDYISGTLQGAIWDSMGMPPQDETAEINLAAGMSGLTMSSAAQARADEEEERKKRKKAKKTKVVVLRQ